MGVSYKKLWVKLVENDMKKTDLKEAIGISPNTLSKLSKNEYVSMEIIIKLCEFFDCRIEEIVEVAYKEKR